MDMSNDSVSGTSATRLEVAVLNVGTTGAGATQIELVSPIYSSRTIRFALRALALDAPLGPSAWTISSPIGETPRSSGIN